MISFLVLPCPRRSEAAGEVVAGGLVTTQAHDQDDVQGSLALRLPPRLSRCRTVLPLDVRVGRLRRAY